MRELRFNRLPATGPCSVSLHCSLLKAAIELPEIKVCKVRNSVIEAPHTKRLLLVFHATGSATLTGLWHSRQHFLQLEQRVLAAQVHRRLLQFEERIGRIT